MASILKILEFLRKLCTATDYITRFPGRGVPLLAFLGRKLLIWWRSWFGKPGRPKPAEPPSFGTKASSFSVSDGSAVVREYVISASSVPLSASHPSLHETESQPPAVTQTVSVRHPPVPAGPSADRSHAHDPPSHPLGERSFVNRSYATLSAVSIQSRASDRFSIITTSRDALRSTHGRPSRGAFTPFGRGPDLSRYRERSTQPTPTHPHRPTHASLLEVISTTLPSTDGDGKVGPGPVVQPSASSSHTHEPLPLNEIRRRQPPTSPTSVVVTVQSPSTELPMSSLTDRRQITDTIVDPHDKPGSPPFTNPLTVDYFIPEGRFVQLINSEQIPRYTGDATMQVSYTILSVHSYTSLQTSRRDSLRCETFNNRIPLVRCNSNDIVQFNTTLSSFPEPNGFEQGSLQNDCTPWIPATHPNGGLYFYDKGRVRVSVIVDIPSHV